ncbi:MAG: hypothetical protein R3C28_25845 [Pirellulaceae bacterium]
MNSLQLSYALQSAVLAGFFATLLSIYILVVMWTYQDANARNKPGTIVAAMVAMIPFGLFAWLVMRPPATARTPPLKLAARFTITRLFVFLTLFAVCLTLVIATSTRTAQAILHIRDPFPPTSTTSTRMPSGSRSPVPIDRAEYVRQRLSPEFVAAAVKRCTGSDDARFARIVYDRLSVGGFARGEVVFISLRMNILRDDQQRTLDLLNEITDSFVTQEANSPTAADMEILQSAVIP